MKIKNVEKVIFEKLGQKLCACEYAYFFTVYAQRKVTSCGENED